MVSQPIAARGAPSSTALPDDAWVELAAIVGVAAGETPGGDDEIIERWNARAEQLFGYRAEEVIGKPISILVPPERLDELADLVARMRAGEPVERLETVRRRKDGVDFDVSLNVSPVRAPTGEIVGASALIYDISEWKRLAEKQSFLAEASRLLAVNLDHAQSLAEIAALTLLRIADGCTVELVDAAGTLTQIAVANRTPEKVELKRETRRRYPADADSRVSPVMPDRRRTPRPRTMAVR